MKGSGVGEALRVFCPSCRNLRAGVTAERDFMPTPRRLAVFGLLVDVCTVCDKVAGMPPASWRRLESARLRRSAKAD